MECGVPDASVRGNTWPNGKEEWLSGALPDSEYESTVHRTKDVSLLPDKNDMIRCDTSLFRGLLSLGCLSAARTDIGIRTVLTTIIQNLCLHLGTRHRTSADGDPVCFQTAQE